MGIFELTELQYSEDHNGPWQIYVYTKYGFHRGGTWFAKTTKHPEETTTIDRAHRMAIEAIANALEVRVCDGGDNMVFHSRSGKILYGENFWKELGVE